VAQPGDHVSSIDTPALVLDLDAMERNEVLGRASGDAVL